MIDGTGIYAEYTVYKIVDRELVPDPVVEWIGIIRFLFEIVRFFSEIVQSLLEIVRSGMFRRREGRVAEDSDRRR